jgi:hypothetical protein
MKKKQNSKFFQDLGCKIKGFYTCLNGGKCLENGNCECKLGYSGLTCSYCKCYFLNMNKYLINTQFLLPL